MFYFSHGGHLGLLTRSSETFFKLDTPMMIVAKFGKIWPSSFRGQDFFVKVNRRHRTTTTTDDGRKVTRTAHLALRARSDKKVTTYEHMIISNSNLEISINTVKKMINKAIHLTTNIRIL